MIRLKKLTQKDTSYFLEVNNHPDILYWMESDKPYQRKDVFAILVCNFVQWYVIYDDKEKVGLFTTYVTDNKLNIGIIIEEEHRRRGYAKKAFEIYLEVADQEKIDTYLSCFIDNFAVNLYKSLGYKRLDKDKKIRDRDYMYMWRKYK